MTNPYQWLLPAAALLLAACAQQPRTLYAWNGYNETVYERLKSDGKPITEQLQHMEKYMQTARDKQQTPAPGSHAHLGLLLADSGQMQQAAEQFDAEKQLFPESAVFMDFLNRHYTGAKK